MIAQQQEADPLEKPFVLHSSTREALLDVVARDRHGNTVNDLAANELHVLELGKHGQKTEKRILWMRTIDPRKDESQTEAGDAGLRISSGAVCALNATMRYKLAISASPEAGYHEVQVKTTRPQVTLSYRRRYFVGETRSSIQATHKHVSDSNSLEEDACLHPSIPPSLAINALPMATGGENTTRYVLIVQPESLAEIGLDGSSLQVQLDFGVCTSNVATPGGKYGHWALVKELSPAEMDQAQEHGLSNILEIQGGLPDLARFVVRDRGTGNIGIVDVAKPHILAVQADRAKGDRKESRSLAEPPGSFGYVIPRENSFCGDVYELPMGTPMLPDFWDLDPVGSIYTDSLNVPNQDLFSFRGIPGATMRKWFAVDYYGEFYIRKPGEYEFEIQSDDGSRLEIDNQVLADLDGTHPVLTKVVRMNLAAGLHSIHVPYMQSLPERLALKLQIKPPGESMRLFNLNEFAPPRTSLPGAVD